MGSDMLKGLFEGLMILCFIAGLLAAGLIWLCVWLFSHISILWL